jgi:hypothetical protein
VNATDCTNVPAACWKLPHRSSGDCSPSTGATESTQRSTGPLGPMLAALRASATRTISSVAVASVPFGFSALSAG